jgi:hypothetical protein
MKALLRIENRSGGLQMAFFCASGAHVLKYAPLRFSKTTIFAPPERFSAASLKSK